MSFFSRSNYEVAELTWENGQLAMHGLLPTTSTKATCSTGETLESIVNQATYPTKELNSEQRHQNPQKISSIFASSDGKWGENSCPVQMNLGIIKKRIRSEPEQQGRNMTSSIQEECADCGAWASNGAAFCWDDDTTMMTWASFASPRSLRTKTMDEDSVSHGGVGSQDKEDRTRRETARSSKSRKRNHAAAIHNQSERRRRDRINQKMKDLQKLVPNATKTDKASMLDEVIAYLKQLQAQVHMMSLRNMPQVMMPLGMQQHLQMSSLLPHIGVNVGLGTVPRMLDLYSIAHAAAAAAPPPPHSLSPLIQPTTVPTATSPSFVPPTFLMPHLTLKHNPDIRINTSGPFNDPYSAFLAQSMNMELYNKMAIHYQQQVNQATQNINRPSQSNHIQGD